MSVIILIVAFLVGFIAPSPVRAEALFETGYIGMTQSELRAKLGPPHKVRTRMAAQRVYTYHPLAEWDNVLRDQMSSASGEDVYQFVRDRVDVRYSFHYVEERVPNSDTPELTVNLVDIEFLSPDPSTGSVDTPVTVPLSVPIKDVPKLVPEFTPSPADEAPTYRSNLFIVLIQDKVSKTARRLVRERAKEEYEWALAYRLYSSEGFPARISVTDTINRVEFDIDSAQFIKDHHKLTHEPMLNPFSQKAVSQPPPPEPVKKKIPTPRYAP